MIVRGDSSIIILHLLSYARQKERVSNNAASIFLIKFRLSKKSFLKSYSRIVINLISK